MGYLQKAADRDLRIIKWVDEAPDHEREGHELAGVWWGVFRHPSSEDVHPPSAVFQEKELAEAFAQILCHDEGEWVVAPLLFKSDDAGETFVTRNSFEVPE